MLDNKAEQSYEVMAYWRYVERVTDATTQEDSAYSKFFLFVYSVPEGTHKVQVANFADCRTEITTASLYTNFLVANLNQVVDDFAQEGFTQYNTLNAIGVSAGGKFDFGRTRSQVEDFFAFNFIGLSSTIISDMIAFL